MLSRFRDRFGVAGVIAVIALFFAMGGGAYAAKKYVLTSTSQISPKVLKALKGKAGKAGKAGATGATGPAGPQGPKGDAGAPGANGSNGTNGSNGQSVTVSTEPPGAHCADAGQKLVSASGTTYVCNGSNGDQGPEGSPWTPDGTLPAGATETGVWGAIANSDGAAYVPVSFPIPLASGLDNDHVVMIEAGDTPPSTCEDGQSPASSAAHPEADSGYLCVFAGGSGGGASDLPFTTRNPESGDIFAGASANGTLLYIATSGGEGVFGTFAVTG